MPDGLRAYVVNNVELNNETGNYELSLQRLLVIPAQTGVILYGHPNGKNLNGDPILSLTPVKFAEEGEDIIGDDGKPTGEKYDRDHGKALCRANWDYLKNISPEDFALYKNFLEPTSTANGGKYVKPYEKEETSGKVAFRNFAMGRYKNTFYDDAAETPDDQNYMGFFRMVAGTYPTGYAYLRLAGDVDENGNEFPVKDADGNVVAVSEYAAVTGSEILVKEDKGPNNDGINGYYYERNLKSGALYDARAKIGTDEEKDWNPRKWWDENASPVPFTWKEGTHSWGDRTKKFPTSQVLKYYGELEDADGIVKLSIPAEKNDKGEYYTLQGVKITNPSKGIYISNGKKVVIK